MKQIFTKLKYPALLILATTLATPVLAELAAPTFNEDNSTKGSMERLAKSIGAMDEGMSTDKKLLVADNMRLTVEEAKGFWPVYETYQKELHQINKRLAKVIDIYALEHSKGALSNKLAKELLNEVLAIKLAEVKLQQSYVSKFGKVISMAKVARYLQTENKIHAVLYYELAGKIPLVE